MHQQHQNKRRQQAQAAAPAPAGLSLILKKGLSDAKQRAYNLDAKPPWRPAGRLEKAIDETGPIDEGVGPSYTSPSGSPRGAAPHYFAVPPAAASGQLLGNGSAAWARPPSDMDAPKSRPTVRGLADLGPQLSDPRISAAGALRPAAAEARSISPTWMTAAAAESRRPSSVGTGPALASARSRPAYPQEATLFTADGVQFSGRNEDMYMRPKVAGVSLAQAHAASITAAGHQCGIPAPARQRSPGRDSSNVSVGALPYQSQLRQLKQSATATAHPAPAAAGVAAASAAAPPAAAGPFGIDCSSRWAASRIDIELGQEVRRLDPTLAHQPWHSAELSFRNSLLQPLPQSVPGQLPLGMSQQPNLPLRMQDAAARVSAAAAPPASVLDTARGISGIHPASSVAIAAALFTSTGRLLSAASKAHLDLSHGGQQVVGQGRCSTSNPRVPAPGQQPVPQAAVAWKALRHPSAPARDSTRRDASKSRQLRVSGCGAATTARGLGIVDTSVRVNQNAKRFLDSGAAYARPGENIASKQLPAAIELAELLQQHQQQRQQQSTLYGSKAGAVGAPLSVLANIPSAAVERAMVSPLSSQKQQSQQLQQPHGQQNSGHAFGGQIPYYQYSPPSKLSAGPAGIMGEQQGDAGNAGSSPVTSRPVQVAGLPPAVSGAASTLAAVQRPAAAAHVTHVAAPPADDHTVMGLSVPGRLESLFNRQLCPHNPKPSVLMDTPSPAGGGCSSVGLLSAAAVVIGDGAPVTVAAATDVAGSACAWAATTGSRGGCSHDVQSQVPGALHRDCRPPSSLVTLELPYDSSPSGQSFGPALPRGLAGADGAAHAPPGDTEPGRVSEPMAVASVAITPMESAASAQTTLAVPASGIPPRLVLQSASQGSQAAGASRSSGARAGIDPAAASLALLAREVSVEAAGLEELDQTADAAVRQLIMSSVPVASAVLLPRLQQQGMSQDGPQQWCEASAVQACIPAEGCGAVEPVPSRPQQQEHEQHQEQMESAWSTLNPMPSPASSSGSIQVPTAFQVAAVPSAASLTGPSDPLLTLSRATPTTCCSATRQQPVAASRAQDPASGETAQPPPSKSASSAPAQTEDLQHVGNGTRSAVRWLSEAAAEAEATHAHLLRLCPDQLVEPPCLGKSHLRPVVLGVTLGLKKHEWLTEELLQGTAEDDAWSPSRRTGVGIHGAMAGAPDAAAGLALPTSPPLGLDGHADGSGPYDYDEEEQKANLTEIMRLAVKIVPPAAQHGARALAGAGALLNGSAISTPSVPPSDSSSGLSPFAPHGFAPVAEASFASTLSEGIAVLSAAASLDLIYLQQGDQQAFAAEPFGALGPGSRLSSSTTGRVGMPPVQMLQLLERALPYGGAAASSASLSCSLSSGYSSISPRVLVLPRAEQQHLPQPSAHVASSPLSPGSPLDSDSVADAAVHLPSNADAAQRLVLTGDASGFAPLFAPEAGASPGISRIPRAAAAPLVRVSTCLAATPMDYSVTVRSPEAVIPKHLVASRCRVLDAECSRADSSALQPQPGRLFLAAQQRERQVKPVGKVQLRLAPPSPLAVAEFQRQQQEEQQAVGRLSADRLCFGGGSTGGATSSMVPNMEGLPSVPVAVHRQQFEEGLSTIDSGRPRAGASMPRDGPFLAHVEHSGRAAGDAAAEKPPSSQCLGAGVSDNVDGFSGSQGSPAFCAAERVCDQQRLAQLQEEQERPQTFDLPLAPSTSASSPASGPTCWAVLCGFTPARMPAASERAIASELVASPQLPAADSPSVSHSTPQSSPSRGTSARFEGSGDMRQPSLTVSPSSSSLSSVEAPSPWPCIAGAVVHAAIDLHQSGGRCRSPTRKQQQERCTAATSHGALFGLTCPGAMHQCGSATDGAAGSSVPTAHDASSPFRLPATTEPERVPPGAVGCSSSLANRAGAPASRVVPVHGLKAARPSASAPASGLMQASAPAQTFVSLAAGVMASDDHDTTYPLEDMDSDGGDEDLLTYLERRDRLGVQGPSGGADNCCFGPTRVGAPCVTSDAANVAGSKGVAVPSMGGEWSSPRLCLDEQLSSDGMRMPGPLHAAARPASGSSSASGVSSGSASESARQPAFLLPGSPASASDVGAIPQLEGLLVLASRTNPGFAISPLKPQEQGSPSRWEQQQKGMELPPSSWLPVFIPTCTAGDNLEHICNGAAVPPTSNTQAQLPPVVSHDFSTVFLCVGDAAFSPSLPPPVLVATAGVMATPAPSRCRRGLAVDIPENCTLSSAQPSPARGYGLPPGVPFSPLPSPTSWREREVLPHERPMGLAPDWKQQPNENDKIHTLLWSTPFMRSNWLPRRPSYPTSTPCASRPATPRPAGDRSGGGFGGGEAPLGSGLQLPQEFGCRSSAAPPVKLHVVAAPARQAPAVQGASIADVAAACCKAEVQLCSMAQRHLSGGERLDAGSAVAAVALEVNGYTDNGLAPLGCASVSAPMLPPAAPVSAGVSASASWPAVVASCAPLVSTTTPDFACRGGDVGLCSRDGGTGADATPALPRPAAHRTPPSLSFAVYAGGEQRLVPHSLVRSTAAAPSSPSNSSHQSFGFPGLRPVDSPGGIVVGPGRTASSDSASGSAGSRKHQHQGSPTRSASGRGARGFLSGSEAVCLVAGFNVDGDDSLSEGAPTPGSATSAGGSSCSFGDELPAAANTGDGIVHLGTCKGGDDSGGAGTAGSAPWGRPHGHDDYTASDRCPCSTWCASAKLPSVAEDPQAVPPSAWELPAEPPGGPGAASYNSECWHQQQQARHGASLQHYLGNSSYAGATTGASISANVRYTAEHTDDEDYDDVVTQPQPGVSSLHDEEDQEEGMLKAESGTLTGDPCAHDYITALVSDHAVPAASAFGSNSDGGAASPWQAARSGSIIQVCSCLEGFSATPGTGTTSQVERRLVFDTPKQQKMQAGWPRTTLAAASAEVDLVHDGDGSDAEDVLRAEPQRAVLASPPSFGFNLPGQWQQHQRGSIGAVPEVWGQWLGVSEAASTAQDSVRSEGGSESFEVDEACELLLPSNVSLDELLATAEGLVLARGLATPPDSNSGGLAAADEMVSSCGSAPGPATRAARLHDVHHAAYDAREGGLGHAPGTSSSAAAATCPAMGPTPARLWQGLSFLSPCFNPGSYVCAASVGPGTSSSVGLSGIQAGGCDNDAAGATTAGGGQGKSFGTPMLVTSASPAEPDERDVGRRRRDTAPVPNAAPWPVSEAAVDGDGGLAATHSRCHGRPGGSSGSSRSDGSSGSDDSLSRQVDHGGNSSSHCSALLGELQQQNLMADLRAELQRRSIQATVTSQTPEHPSCRTSSGSSEHSHTVTVSVGTSPMPLGGRWTPTQKHTASPADLHRKAVPAPPPMAVRGGAPPPPPPPLRGAPKGFKRVTPSREQQLRLKQLHWDKLPEAAPGSFWELVQHNRPWLAPERQAQLRETFSLSDNAAVLKRLAAGGGGAGAGDNSGPGAGPVRLMDNSRAHNISIVLAGIKRDAAELCDAILRLDSSGLEVEQLRALLKGVPRSTELAELQAYMQGSHPRYPGVSDPALLGTVERYFVEASRLPWLEQRLSAMALIRGFDVAVQQVRQLISVVQRAVGDVRDNAELQLLLGRILVVGNTLNEGTARAGAAGYKLDVLMSLAGIKGANKASLLHWVVAQLQEEGQALPAQLGACVRAAANVQLSSVSGLLEELRGGVELMAGQVEALLGMAAEDAVGISATALSQPQRRSEELELQRLADSLFLQQCTAFLAEGRPRVAALAELQAGCMAGLRDLAAFFQDEFDPRDPSRQLQQLRDFLASLDKVVRDMEAERERAAREQAAVRRVANLRRISAGGAGANSRNSAISGSAGAVAAVDGDGGDVSSAAGPQL